MFAFDKKDFQRFAVSTVGAIVLSTACVVAAVGPAHAGSPAPLTVSDWQHNVERQIGGWMSNSAALPDFNGGEAVVEIQFSANGDYAGAALAQSSGVGLFDRHALYVAKHIAYPVLPAGVRGTAQTVEMRLSYADAPVTNPSQRPAQLAFRAVDGVRVAAK